MHSSCDSKHEKKTASLSQRICVLSGGTSAAFFGVGWARKKRKVSWPSEKKSGQKSHPCRLFTVSSSSESKCFLCSNIEVRTALAYSRVCATQRKLPCHVVPLSCGTLVSRSALVRKVSAKRPRSGMGQKYDETKCAFCWRAEVILCKKFSRPRETLCVKKPLG